MTDVEILRSGSTVYPADFAAMVRYLTGGRPNLFVVMAYGGRWEIYQTIKQVAESEFGLACIRADELGSSGYDLLTKVHLLITRSERVIAEISEPSVNVFYEVGYAVGVQKPPLLLIQDDREVPVDPRRLEVVRYRNDLSEASAAALRGELGRQLYARMNPDLALFHDLLEAPHPLPVAIVTSPSAPVPGGTVATGVDRTVGDYLGVQGLLGAFGYMRRPTGGVELISGRTAPTDLLERDLSLYLIGSPAVTPQVAALLDHVQRGTDTRWGFGPARGSGDDGTRGPTALYRGDELLPSEVDQPLEDGRPHRLTDHGIVVRAPHPAHPERRLVMILAGPHHLGTGAACLAATRPELIRKIKARLPEGTFADKGRAFWVLVRGHRSPRDGLLDPEGVEIVQAGV
jgi:hypothetical protein